MPLSSRITRRVPELGLMRELSTPHGTLRCYEAGAGEPVVFVHGMLVNANVWRRVVQRLSPDFRCITFDLPMGGHLVPTESADLSLPGIARMIVDALDALGVERATFVGNDTGTGLCQVIAADHRHRVHSLILTSGDFRENSPAKLFRFMPLAGRVPGGMLMYLGPAALRPMRMMYRLPIAFGWLIKRLRDYDILDTYFQPTVWSREIRKDMHAFAREYRNHHAIEAAHALGNFERPVLIAWSREDKFFPPAHAVELSELVEDAQLEWIDDSYTISAEDQPERLAELIGAFMREPRLSQVA